MKGAESRGMEYLGASDYREVRTRKGRGLPRRFTHVPPNKLLSEGEIRGPYRSAISRLP